MMFDYDLPKRCDQPKLRRILNESNHRPTRGAGSLLNSNELELKKSCWSGKGAGKEQR